MESKQDRHLLPDRRRILGGLVLCAAGVAQYPLPALAEPDEDRPRTVPRGDGESRRRFIWELEKKLRELFPDLRGKDLRRAKKEWDRLMRRLGPLGRRIARMLARLGARGNKRGMLFRDVWKDTLALLAAILQLSIWLAGGGSNRRILMKSFLRKQPALKKLFRAISALFKGLSKQLKALSKATSLRQARSILEKMVKDIQRVKKALAREIARLKAQQALARRKGYNPELWGKAGVVDNLLKMLEHMLVRLNAAEASYTKLAKAL